MSWAGLVYTVTDVRLANHEWIRISPPVNKNKTNHLHFYHRSINMATKRQDITLSTKPDIIQAIDMSTSALNVGNSDGISFNFDELQTINLTN